MKTYATFKRRDRLVTLPVVLIACSVSSLYGASNYPVVDTGQNQCYDNQRIITPPKAGQLFYRQDAQRSDPKTGDPALFPHGRGPQGDVIRIDNYVRLSGAK